jgi:hypothetical protein
MFVVEKTIDYVTNLEYFRPNVQSHYVDPDCLYGASHYVHLPPLIHICLLTIF